MKIVIPMSGSGNRFIEAGYQDPKPLIKVDGIPIIEYVTKMFPGEPDENFIFICRNEHLEKTEMRKILNNLKPNAKIIETQPAKLGPVYAVTKAFDFIDDEEQVIVNYCDFFQSWDYEDFKKVVNENKCDGNVVSYIGFHPHLLIKDNFYATTNVDENNYVSEIREKYSFTEDKTKCPQSGGTYYFKKGSYVKKYFTELMERDINLKGEFYVSLVYNLMIEDGLKIHVYDKVKHFCQWGIPQDLSAYNYWSDIFKALIRDKKNIKIENLINLIPMAGAGSRFRKEGYTISKPLIKVSNKHMIFQASDTLPKADEWLYVCREEDIRNENIDKKLKSYDNNVTVISVDKLTEGQASTCLLAKEKINNKKELLIAASDNGMIWDESRFLRLKEECDCLVWTFRNNQTVMEKPEGYGWVIVDSDDETVKNMSVKVPISDNPIKDHAVVGAFWFREGNIFVEATEKMIRENIRINNEFYVDEAINQVIQLGYKVKVMEIDKYICWGTPNDLKIFEYWQEFFNEMNFHEYSKEKDNYYGR